MSTQLSGLRSQVLTAADVDALHRWGLDVEAWPVGSHVWGQYAEETSTGAKPCRTENVSACHDGVAGLVDGVIRDVAAEALGEAATAFKDKLNYKHPGGAGFSPHQDRLAYPGAQRVVSVLVAIDECTTESGCLWLADGIDVALPTDDRGVVRDDVVAALPWVAAELAPGDAVCLDGLTPHYSEANRGDGARRVLVASYAPTSEGYERSAYYEARQATMTSATTQDGRFRIGTLADFEGTEVGGNTPASDRCTHPPAR